MFGVGKNDSCYTKELNYNQYVTMSPATLNILRVSKTDVFTFIYKILLPANELLPV